MNKLVSQRVAEIPEINLGDDRNHIASRVKTINGYNSPSFNVGCQLHEIEIRSVKSLSTRDRVAEQIQIHCKEEILEEFPMVFKTQHLNIAKPIGSVGHSGGNIETELIGHCLRNL